MFKCRLGLGPESSRLSPCRAQPEVGRDTCLVRLYSKRPPQPAWEPADSWWCATNQRSASCRLGFPWRQFLAPYVQDRMAILRSQVQILGTMCMPVDSSTLLKSYETQYLAQTKEIVATCSPMMNYIYA